MIQNHTPWQDLLFSFPHSYQGEPNPSMHGIPLSALQSARAPTPVGLAELQALTLEEAKVVATNAWWKPVMGDFLPDGVDIVLVDCAYDLGPAEAIKLLQDCLGFTGTDRDGFLGVVTLQAVMKQNPAKLIHEYVRLQMTPASQGGRLDELKLDPSSTVGSPEWKVRTEKMRDLALSVVRNKAPATVASENKNSTNAVSLAALVALVPVIIAALPEARTAYDSTVKALSPFEAVASWLPMAAGAIVMAGVIFLQVRAVGLVNRAKESGSTAEVVR